MAALVFNALMLWLTSSFLFSVHENSFQRKYKVLNGYV